MQFLDKMLLIGLRSKAYKNNKKYSHSSNKRVELNEQGEDFFCVVLTNFEIKTTLIKLVK